MELFRRLLNTTILLTILVFKVQLVEVFSEILSNLPVGKTFSKEE